MIKACLALVLCTAAFGGTIVVPNDKTSAEGNLQNGGPPSPFPGISEMLFDASQFPTGRILISSISFRAKVGSGPVDIAYGDVDVYLSTSSKSPDGGSPNRMSETF